MAESNPEPPLDPRDRHPLWAGTVEKTDEKTLAVKAGLQKLLQHVRIVGGCLSPEEGFEVVNTDHYRFLAEDATTAPTSGPRVMVDETAGKLPADVQPRHSVCSCAGGIVLTGGHRSRLCSMYHTATKKWEQKADLLQERDSHGSFSVKCIASCFIIGGNNTCTPDGSESYLSTIEYLNIRDDGNAWHCMELDGKTVTLPGKWLSPCACVLPEVAGSSVETAYIFNPADGQLVKLLISSWCFYRPIPLASCPEPTGGLALGVRGSASMVALGAHHYAPLCVCTAEATYIYSTVEDVWTELTTACPLLLNPRPEPSSPDPAKPMSPRLAELTSVPGQHWCPALLYQHMTKQDVGVLMLLGGKHNKHGTDEVEIFLLRFDSLKRGASHVIGLAKHVEERSICLPPGLCGHHAYVQPPDHWWLSSAVSWMVSWVIDW